MKICHGVNENPSFIPMCFGTTKRWKSGENFILHSFYVVIITFKSFLIIFSIEFQYASTTESCLGSVPHAEPP